MNKCQDCNHFKLDQNPKFGTCERIFDGTLVTLYIDYCPRCALDMYVESNLDMDISANFGCVLWEEKR